MLSEHYTPAVTASLATRTERRRLSAARSRARRDDLGMTLDQARWNQWVRPTRFKVAGRGSDHE